MSPHYCYGHHCRGALVSSHVNFFRMSHVGVEVGPIFWCNVQTSIYCCQKETLICCIWSCFFSVDNHMWTHHSLITCPSRPRNVPPTGTRKPIISSKRTLKEWMNRAMNRATPQLCPGGWCRPTVYGLRLRVPQHMF